MRRSIAVIATLAAVAVPSLFADEIKKPEQLADEHQIKGCPTIIIFRSGEPVARREGCQAVDAFCDWLTKLP